MEAPIISRDPAGPGRGRYPVSGSMTAGRAVQPGRGASGRTSGYLSQHPRALLLVVGAPGLLRPLTQHHDPGAAGQLRPAAEAIEGNTHHE